MARINPNRRIERAGVNALRTLLEQHDHIVHEIDGNNDYGEDMYVNFVDKGQRTGYTIAIQVKSGQKYKRTNGYAIPVGTHRDDWEQSRVPVIGVVHDAKQNKLFWCNLTERLKSELNKGWVDIPETAELSSLTLANFTEEVCSSARRVEYVEVHEIKGGNFVLTNRSGVYLNDLRIESNRSNEDAYLPASHAVINRSEIDELEPDEAVIIGHRYRARTWTHSNPVIIVAGRTCDGDKFHEYFEGFMP
nr:DUF4365 domain-containing protein [Kibdelosporangium sp. MJ126-NF4]